MNWYITAQEEMSFEAWLGKELAKYTQQYSSPIFDAPKKIEMLKKWMEATGEDATKYSFVKAYDQAFKWYISEGIEPKPVSLSDLNLEKIAEVLATGYDYGDEIDPRTIEVRKIEQINGIDLIGREAPGEIIYAVHVDYDRPQGSTRDRAGRRGAATLATKDGEYFVAWQ